jgi:hypothetical protein
MFHAQPFDSFSCKSFKEPPLGAELAFFTQRASFFNKIESDMKASRVKFQKFSEWFAPTFKNRQISEWFAPTLKTNKFRMVRPLSENSWDDKGSCSLKLDDFART